jgi:antirestriction protein ArdC
MWNREWAPMNTNQRMNGELNHLPMNPPALRATNSDENVVLLISNDLRSYFRGNPKMVERGTFPLTQRVERGVHAASTSYAARTFHFEAA